MQHTHKKGQFLASHFFTQGAHEEREASAYIKTSFKLRNVIITGIL